MPERVQIIVKTYSLAIAVEAPRDLRRSKAKDISFRIFMDGQHINDKLGQKDHAIAEQIVKELDSRLQFLIDVGLEYLTLSRSDGGPDAAFSMEPSEFKTMVEGIRIIEQSVGSVTYELTRKQEREREHSRSLFVVKDIKEGEVFTEENVRSIRPGLGLHTKHYEEVLGKTARCDVKKGTPLSWDLVN